MPGKERLKVAGHGDGTIWLGSASITHGDSLKACDGWLALACIISDGPYGLGKYPGEPNTPDGLAEFYAPHAAALARRRSRTASSRRPASSSSSAATARASSTSSVSFSMVPVPSH